MKFVHYCMTKFTVVLLHSQTTAEAEEGLGKLKSKLEALVNITDMYTKGPQETSTDNLSKSLEDFARYIVYSSMLKWLDHSRSEIGKLRSSIDDKLGRDQLTAATQSRIYVGDIETLSGAISSILDVFHVRSSVPNSYSFV